MQITKFNILLAFCRRECICTFPFRLPILVFDWAFQITEMQRAHPMSGFEKWKAEFKVYQYLSKKLYDCDHNNYISSIESFLKNLEISGSLCNWRHVQRAVCSEVMLRAIKDCADLQSGYLRQQDVGNVKLLVYFIWVAHIMSSGAHLYVTCMSLPVQIRDGGAICLEGADPAGPLRLHTGC